jgi:peptidoglycan/xylan/chitin deacetylase (PgdA/CDA1 family)
VAAMADGRRLPPHPVVLTFDDGYADLHDTVLPLLRAHGATATVFVTTGWVADAGHQAAGQPLDRTLTWRQVRSLASAGIEVGAHSHSHPQLDQLTAEQLTEELARSRELLRDGTAEPVRTLAYPYGYSNRRVRAAARGTGYAFAAAVGNGAAGAASDPFAVPRLTVRRATDPTTFRALVQGQELARIYRLDRTLTRGYTVVRRCRGAARALVSHD